MTTDSPSLPSPDDWVAWDVSVIREVHAGKQSRVFEASLRGDRVALKLTRADLADAELLAARLESVDVLAARHPDVVAPIRIDGSLVQPIGGWLMSATSFVDGDRLDSASGDDAEDLGRALARLHDEMRRVQPLAIPPIAALGSTGDGGDRSRWQLLHGDFSTDNVISTASSLRIIDFDDCGHGPIEYDIANSLYMVLFDSDVNDRPATYRLFRPAFLAGYSDASAHSIETEFLDEMIAVRIEALRGWLGDLVSAPIGIRTSPASWLETLASFVQRHGPADRV